MSLKEALLLVQLSYFGALITIKEVSFESVQEGPGHLHYKQFRGALLRHIYLVGVNAIGKS